MAARILICDDDSNMRESIVDNLEVEGYEVFQAATGEEAVVLAGQRFFDVILMDYNLTDSTGIEVIHRIREKNTDTQILMLTAHASLDTALRAIQESVYDFLSKPVDFNYLKHRIAKAIEKLRLEQKNRHLNQMKSKFMSMSSHDLANALMTLQVAYEMLSSTISPNEEQKKRMAYISSGISQIARLIDDLVDWAAIEQGKFRLEPTQFSPQHLIEEIVIGPQARAVARGITLGTEIAAGLPDIKVDRKRLTQVLNNLLENAIRHTSAGGAVTVAAAVQGGVLQIAVRDTGEGIAPDDLGKIFQSFYQGQGGSGEQGRLGLGLSISKEIVENHGGRIWVESEGTGKGATFLFTLPLAK